MPTHARGLGALVAVLVVVMVGPGSFGMGSVGASTSRHHARLTTVEPARLTNLAPAAQSNAKRLTDEVRALTGALKSPQRHKAKLSRTLTALSRAREQALLGLLVKDPEAASAFILPRRVRATLTRLHGAKVEKTVELEGRYRTWHRDNFRHPNKDVYLDQLVTREGKVFTLHAATSGIAVSLTFARLKPNARITLRGYVLNGHVLVTKVQSRGRSLASASTATTATVGPINTAVITANFADSTTSIDVNALKALFQGSPGNDVVSYFKEASYGKATLAPSFFGPYRLAESGQSGCGNFNASEMLQLANADIDYTQFKRIIFIENCNNYGASAGNEAPVATPDGTIMAAVIYEDATYSKMLYTQIHELSHTLGTFNMHASAFVCLPDAFTPPTRFDRGCDTAEYGDPFDVLGGAGSRFTGQLDPYHKSVAGWLDASQFPTVTASGTYTLAPYETPGSGIAALNIPRGASGTSLTVEYRQPIGFDAYMSSCGHCTVTQGASIRLAGYVVGGGGGGSDTELIDTTPGTVDDGGYYSLSDFRDGALLPGKSFTDPESGITITTVSAGASGLVVSVTVPPQVCTRGVPTSSSISPAAQTGTGQTLSYTFTLTNTDSAGCAPNSFRFFPSWSLSNMQVTATPDVLALAPGGSATVTVTATPVAPATAGSYSFSPGQISSNALGSYSTALPSLTYQLTAATDTIVPTAPSSPVAKADGSSVAHLSWGASTDNVGVIGYRIVRDNSSTFTTAGPSMIDTSLSPGTSYSYSIQAFDARGNNSPAVSVSVSTPAKTDYTPPTPPMVTVTATDRTADLSWGPSSDNVGVAAYRISPCLVPQCSNLPPSTTALHLARLMTQTRYDLTVVAVDGDGNVAYSRQGTIYTGPQGDSPPTQPEHFYSSSATFAGATLAWSASTGATAYRVYRNNRPFATVTGTTFTDANPGAHEYYVQAVDAAGALSAPTPRVWALTPAMASSDMTAPTASVTAPANGTAVSGIVTVASQPSDNVRVSRVEFYVDGVLATTSYSSPSTFQWDATRLSNGSHWLYALAYDAAGNYGSDGGNSVTVANGGGAGGGDTTPPLVSILSPLTGTIVSGAVPVTATATDNVGVASVQFAVDGTQVATSTSAPYGFAWDVSTASAGSHTITATAYDAAGNSSSASTSVSVAAPADSTPPTVSIGSPADGATVSGTTSVQVGASDNVGVTQVTLAVDDAPAGTLTAAPWTFSLDTSRLVAGSHTLTVTASDAAGNSANAQITVTVPAAPTDTTAPKAPSSPRAAVVGNTQVALYWAPSTDNVGVAGYNVYRDGAQIASTTLPNYLDSGLTPGTSYVYSMRAFDAAGNLSTATSNLNAKTPALSTSSTGTIAGVVYNSLGRPLANAIVQLTGTALTKTAKTGTSGTYKFNSLPAGTYTITITPPSTSTSLATIPATTSLTVIAGRTILTTTP